MFFAKFSRQVQLYFQGHEGQSSHWKMEVWSRRYLVHCWTDLHLDDWKWTLDRCLNNSRIRICFDTTCWNCGGKRLRASDCPSKKIGGTPASGGNSVSNQVTSLGESGLLPGMVSLTLKRSLERPTSTTPLPSTGTNKSKTFWEWHRWRKSLLNLWTLKPQLA